MRPRIACLPLFSLVLVAAGCVTQSSDRPARALNPATTQPSHWLDAPAAATASASDFQQLWDACEDSARGYFFKIDRIDYRSGILTTQPLVSAQFFEPWRRDARTGYDLAESSIATIRRTIHFEFTRVGDATWQVAPRVLVERQALSEKRITSPVLYRSAFALPTGTLRPRGTRESDAGILLPERYWYPLRRDAEFERAIAEDVARRVRH